MQMFRVLIFILVSFIALVQAQNYCNLDSCRGSAHIGCRHSGRFTSGCNGRLINMQPHIGLILREHNVRRNQLAGGNLPRFPSAVRMATMIWDAELARLAEFNVMQCRMQHDQCRNTRRFRYAGQNLSIIWSSNIQNMGDFLRQRIGSWWNEHRYTQRSDVESYTRGSVDGRQIGHFTVMANEKNTHVGCAVAQYTAGRQNGTLLACNYAVTNMINNPVYRFGRTASQCSTGRNPNFNNLCSVREVFDVNQWRG